MSDVSDLINSFLTEHHLTRCDGFSNKNIAMPAAKPTYCNDALGHYSTIDYFLCTDTGICSDFSVLDSDINLSDHSPVMVKCRSSHFVSRNKHFNDSNEGSHVTPIESQLRWDKADLITYYTITGQYIHHFCQS